MLADPTTAESHSQWSKTMLEIVAKCYMVFNVLYAQICDSCAGVMFEKKKSLRCPFDLKKTQVESGKASDLATNFDLMEALEMRFGGEERVVVEMVEDDNDNEND